MEERHFAHLLNYRAKRRELLIAAGVAVLSQYLESCGLNPTDLDFLREKKQGVLDQQETLRVAKALQKGPGEIIRTMAFG